MADGDSPALLSGLRGPDIGDDRIDPPRRMSGSSVASPGSRDAPSTGTSSRVVNEEQDPEPTMGDTKKTAGDGVAVVLGVNQARSDAPAAPDSVPTNHRRSQGQGVDDRLEIYPSDDSRSEYGSGSEKQEPVLCSGSGSSPLTMWSSPLSSSCSDNESGHGNKNHNGNHNHSNDNHVGICPACDGQVVLWVANETHCDVIFNACPLCTVLRVTKNLDDNEKDSTMLGKVLNNIFCDFQPLQRRLQFPEYIPRRTLLHIMLLDIDVKVPGQKADPSALINTVKEGVCAVNNAVSEQLCGAVEQTETSMDDKVDSLLKGMESFVNVGWIVDSKIAFFGYIVQSWYDLLLQYECNSQPSVKNLRDLRALTEAIQSASDNLVDETKKTVYSRFIQETIENGLGVFRSILFQPSGTDVVVGSRVWPLSDLSGSEDDSGRVSSCREDVDPPETASNAHDSSSDMHHERRTVREVPDPIPPQEGRIQEKPTDPSPAVSADIDRFVEIVEFYQASPDHNVQTEPSVEAARALRQIHHHLKNQHGPSIETCSKAHLLDALLSALERWSAYSTMVLLCLESVGLIIDAARSPATVARSLRATMQLSFEGNGVQEAACRALRRLLTAHGTAWLEREQPTPFVNSIIAAMDRCQSIAPSQVDGCRCLWLLVRSDINGDAEIGSVIANMGGFEVVVRAMVGFKTDKEIQAMGCALLGDLFIQSERVPATNWIDAILTAIETHSNRSIIVRTGIRALKNASHNNTQRLVTPGLFQHDVTRTVLGVMEKHLGKVSIQIEALGLFVQLANNPTFLSALVDIPGPDGMDLILEQVGFYFDNKDVQILGCTFLARCIQNAEETVRPEFREVAHRARDLVLLAMDFYMKDSQVQMLGCELIAAIAEEEQYHITLVDAGLFRQVLMAVLGHKSDTGVHIHGYAALSLLVGDNDELWRTECPSDETDMVNAVVNSIQVFGSDVGLVTKATGLLVKMSNKECINAIIADSDYLPAILRSMKENPGNLEVHRNNVYLIRRLAAIHKDLLNFSVIEAVLDSMARFPDDAKLQYDGNMALLTISTTMNKGLGKRVLPAVLSNLNSHPSTTNVQVSGFQLLSFIAMAKQTREAIPVQELGTLLDLMNRNRGDERVASEMSSLLLGVASEDRLRTNNETAKKILMAVVSMMKHQPHNEAVQSDGCQILERFCCEESLIRALAERGGIDRLVFAILNAGVNKPIVSCVYRTLWEAAKLRQARLCILKKGGDRAILKSLKIHNGDRDIQLGGYNILSSLWSIPDLVRLRVPMVQSLKTALTTHSENTDIVKRILEAIWPLAGNNSSGRVLREQGIDDTIAGVASGDALVIGDRIVQLLRQGTSSSSRTVTIAT